jgi:hypothetical protein
MATLTADRPDVQRSLLDPHEEDHAAPRRPRGPDAETLDAVVTETWRQLTTAHTAMCLVCGGDVRPRWSAGPHPVGGICRECGTEIA